MSKFVGESDLMNYEFFFLYGVDVKNKTLYMGSEADIEGAETGCDYAMAERSLKGLHLLDNLADDRPITVVMNNIGGDELHGMAIYDRIKECSVNVIVEVRGHAMSMGSIILQAGDVRRMSKHSKIMLHYGTSNHHPDHHAHNSKRIQEESDKFDRLMEDIFLEKLQEKASHKVRRQWLKNKMTHDWFINAEEALELGLIDEIIPQ